MPARALPDSTIRKTYDAWIECGKDIAATGRRLKVSARAVAHRLEHAAKRMGLNIDRTGGVMEVYSRKRPEFTFTPLPDDDVPIEDLLEHRKKQFAKKKAHEQARKLIRVDIKIDGPFGGAALRRPAR